MGLSLPTIVSGCQAGVDRGAADVAREMSAPYWGWVPAGRRAEDGLLPEWYPVLETPSRDWLQRTEWNVRDTDATLILAPSETLEGGTKRTYEIAEAYGRPCVALTPYGDPCNSVSMLLWWLEKYKIVSLNVAGPRASKWPQGYDAAYHLVGELLHSVRQEIDRRVPF